MANQILFVSETEITIGDVITINCLKPSYTMGYYVYYLYLDNVQISSFNSLPYTLNYSFENSGTYTISLKGDRFGDIRDIETVTITVTAESLISLLVDKIKSVFEEKTNKVTSWSSTTNDTHYPSEKLVKQDIDTLTDKKVTKCKIGVANNAMNQPTFQMFEEHNPIEVVQGTPIKIYIYDKNNNNIINTHGRDNVQVSIGLWDTVYRRPIENDKDYAYLTINLSPGTLYVTVLAYIDGIIVAKKFITVQSVSSYSNYTLELTSNTTSADINQDVIFTATVKLNNTVQQDRMMSFNDGNHTLKNVKTNANGQSTLTKSWSEYGNYTIEAYYHNVKASKSITIEQPLTMTFTGTTFTPLNSTANKGLIGSNMVIDWGDGNTASLTSNSKLPSHTYSTSGTHTIKVTGNVISLGNYCFRGITDLKTVIIPSSVTSFGTYTFYGCSGLTSIKIPSSVSSIGNNAFRNCSALVDYQLYWTTPPITWSSTLMPNNTNTHWTIPNGTTSNYTSKSFPSAKLIERSA